MPPLGPLDHVALHVSDMAASVRWYSDVLGLKHIYPDAWDGVPTILVEPVSRAGVALFPVHAGAPRNATDGRIAIDHFAFRVTTESLALWAEDLHARGIPFEPKDHGVCASIYLSDPDGHVVEITAYRNA